MDKLPQNPIKKAFIKMAARPKDNVPAQTFELDLNFDVNNFDYGERLAIIRQLKQQIINLYSFLHGDVGIVTFDYEKVF